MFHYLLLLTSLLYSIYNVNGQSCKPVQVVMTRAVGTPANYSEATKTWSLAFPLSNVNFASLGGSLKFIMSETIDKETGYANCQRKNNVNYIQFFLVTYCNPDPALAYFSQKSIFNQSSFGDFGEFVAFDSGACHADDPVCGALVGTSGTIPYLHQFVGWQNESADARNPTASSYWYSTPGECPTDVWAKKTPTCTQKFPSGLCAAGKIPDGVNCTYGYKMLGQVVLDELVGITALKHNTTGKPYVNATDFCNSGGIEFQRDPVTYEFIQGLPFWKAPLSVEANTKRIAQMLALYKKDPRNTPIMEPAALAKANPDCGASAPNCVADGKITCTRDDQMMCIPCSQMTTVYPWDTCGKPVTHAFPELKPPVTTANSKLKKVPTSSSSSNSTDSIESAASMMLPSIVYGIIISIIFYMYN